MRAVLDPNVIISGLISRHGRPAQLLLAWEKGRFEVVVSPALLEELERALGYPKLRRYVSSDAALAAVEWLERGATQAIDPDGDPPLRSEDPDDDYLISLAASQQAALASGDRHLLALAGRIPVYSPGDFLDLLDGPPGGRGN